MNLAAINEEKYHGLFELTKNNNKARFLSQCLFRWQNSTYSLNDKKKWFTRPLPTLAAESGISERSASRYLAEFEKLGFIEKRNKLFIKKHLYIRVRQKLLSLLDITDKKSIDNTTAQASSQQKEAKNTLTSNDLPDVGVIKKDRVAECIYKDNNIIINNTVRQNGSVNNSDELIKTPSKHTQNQEEGGNGYKVEAILGERITERFKNYVKGVLHNLQTQYNLQFSNPDKLFAEVIFSVTNTKDQFPGIDNAHHRMNIIAKLLREKRWTTPKGFYNHWDIGQLFKEREEVKTRAYKQSKFEEGVHEVQELTQASDKTSRFTQSHTPQNRVVKSSQYDKNHQLCTIKAQLNAIRRDIKSETNYLEQARGWLANKVAGITDSFLESLEHKIAGMYEELTGLEQRLNAT